MKWRKRSNDGAGWDTLQTMDNGSLIFDGTSPLGQLINRFVQDFRRLEERLVAIQSWQASIEKHLLAKDADMKPGPLKFVPDTSELKLRGECFGSAVNMNKGMPVDLVIIEAEKIYQFLKGQSLTHGNKVH